MDPNDYETLQKTISEITEILHDFVQGIINGKEPLRKKRGISNSNETKIWSGLADEIEKLIGRKEQPGFSSLAKRFEKGKYNIL